MGVYLQGIWRVIVAVTVVMRVAVDVHGRGSATMYACTILFAVFSETKDRLPGVVGRGEGRKTDGRLILTVKIGCHRAYAGRTKGGAGLQ